MDIKFNPDKQHTLITAASISGTGLHTGINVDMTLRPANAGFGFQFQRIDLPGRPVIKADCDLVTETSRGTTLEQNNVKISTVEHILAALVGMGIDNCLIEINGPEIPIMDGMTRAFWARRYWAISWVGSGSWAPSTAWAVVAPTRPTTRPPAAPATKPWARAFSTIASSIPSASAPSSSSTCGSTRKSACAASALIFISTCRTLCSLSPSRCPPTPSSAWPTTPATAPPTAWA